MKKVFNNLFAKLLGANSSFFYFRVLLTLNLLLRKYNILLLSKKGYITLLFMGLFFNVKAGAHINTVLNFNNLGTALLILVFLLTAIFSIILFLKNKSKRDINRVLERNNKILQEANETRERFLSIIGHDLKNPFNSVLGLTSLAIEEWETIPDNEKFNIINEVHLSSTSVYELMDNLLLWAKRQSGTIEAKPNNFDLNQSVIVVYEIFRNQATFKNIKIELKIGEENMVFADEDMINTVLRNLLSNAVKFTRIYGNIIIEIKREASEVKFSITDSGKGIAPDDLKRILDDKDSFSTNGTSAESGTGLGLLVVRDFVKINCGVFWIETEIGHGSKFHFTLPAAKAIPKTENS